MEALVKSQESMVNSNEFERFLERIETEKEKNRQSELNKLRITKIIREIMSVYYFLRYKIGMPYSALSLEDFRVAKGKLNEITNNMLKRRLFKLLPFLPRAINCRHYLRKGYFCHDGTPFGSWNNYFPYYPENWNDEKCIFDLGKIQKNAEVQNCHFVFPPNILDLAETLFQERFGSKNNEDLIHLSETAKEALNPSGRASPPTLKLRRTGEEK